MSEAKDLLASQQQGELVTGADPINILLFPQPGSRREKPPPLTDDEILKLREMIQAFHNISHTCPIAKKALGEPKP